jgi:hypothetical protein
MGRRLTPRHFSVKSFPVHPRYMFPPIYLLDRYVVSKLSGFSSEIADLKLQIRLPLPLCRA